MPQNKFVVVRNAYNSVAKRNKLTPSGAKRKIITRVKKLRACPPIFFYLQTRQTQLTIKYVMIAKTIKEVGCQILIDVLFSTQQKEIDSIPSYYCYVQT